MLYSPVATLTSVEDDRMLVASRRWRPVFLIFGGQMRAFTVPTRPLGSSRTTPKRVSRPLLPLCNRSPRPTHLLGSSFLPAGMPPSPVPGAARPSVSATLLYTRYCCARTRLSPRSVPPSYVLLLWLCTPPSHMRPHIPSPHMRPYTPPPPAATQRPPRCGFPPPSNAHINPGCLPTEKSQNKRNKRTPCGHRCGP